MTLRNILVRAAVLFWLLSVAAIVLIFFTRELLFVEKDMPQADWIVVLGGESSQRVIGAAELYHQGVAPRVFVSGEGDSQLVVRRLIMAGVPSGAVLSEGRSRSTYENAVCVKEALAPFGPQRIVLVSTWHHTRRARSVFRSVWPEIEWGTHGVFPGVEPGRFPVYESGAILAEYVKTIFYVFRHGIFPS